MLKPFAVLFSKRNLHHSYVFVLFQEYLGFFAINIDRNEKTASHFYTGKKVGERINRTGNDAIKTRWNKMRKVSIFITQNPRKFSMFSNQPKSWAKIFEIYKKYALRFIMCESFDSFG